MNFVLIHFLTFSIHSIIKKNKNNNIKIFIYFFILYKRQNKGFVLSGSLILKNIILNYE
jgi:hypothetical protein